MQDALFYDTDNDRCALYISEFFSEETRKNLWLYELIRSGESRKIVIVNYRLNA